VDEHRVRVVQRLPLRVLRQIAQPDSLVEHQLADVDVDVLGNVLRQALHLQLTRHEVEHAALELGALRLANDQDRHRHGDRAIHRELIEVGVQQLVGDGIELVLLHHHLRLFAIQLQRDQRVGTGVRVKNVHHRFRVDRYRHALGQLALPALAVDDRGQAAGRTQAARFVLAAALSLAHFKRCIHKKSCRSTFYVLAARFVFTFGVRRSRFVVAAEPEHEPSSENPEA
jgi:hypothetical protein